MFTWYRRDFHSGTSSLQFPLVALYSFTWQQHKISYGSESYRYLCRSEILTPERKLIPMSCKRGTTVRSGMKSLSWESGTGRACVVIDIKSKMASQSCRPIWRILHVNLIPSCKHVMKSQCHTGMKLAPVRVFTCNHPLTVVLLANGKRQIQNN